MATQSVFRSVEIEKRSTAHEFARAMENAMNSDLKSDMKQGVFSEAKKEEIEMMFQGLKESL